MRLLFPLILVSALPGLAQLKSGPPLPYHAVEGWAKLPAGWNFGETSGVDVDKNDNVWVFNRGAHPVVQLNKSGRMLQAWPDVPAKSSHGIRVDADGNIWTIDVAGHRLMKFTPAGALLMFIGSVGGAAFLVVEVLDETYGIRVEEATRHAVRTRGAAAGGDGEQVVKAPMPGQVTHVAVRPGDLVAAGDPLLVIEAMKMQNEFKARAGGTVTDVRVSAGQAVNPGDILLIIK